MLSRTPPIASSSLSMSSRRRWKKSIRKLKRRKIMLRRSNLRRTLEKIWANQARRCLRKMDRVKMTFLP